MNKKLVYLKAMILIAITLLVQMNISAQTRTANVNNIDQVIKWVKDGSTKKIIFPAGTYEFSETLQIANNNLTLEGCGREKTILKLVAIQNTFIDAKGNDNILTNLTIDGNNNQKSFGNSIFMFNKSKGHTFENVEFKNSLRNGIIGTNGWATNGLVLKNCVFSNISFFPIQIFNRNTIKRDGVVVTNVDKVLIDNCTFKTGYETAISSDNGNDRYNDGNGIGRRYTEITSLGGTIIQNCTFETSKKFHIALVQTSDVIIRNNKFEGMTSDAGSGAQPLHFEQFTHNIEIYDNTFNMPDNTPKIYPYIHFQGTEGHKRVYQERPSNTYASWTYQVSGSNERRASVSCAKSGNINNDCKRDVHAYGARNIFIAGNTFNASTKVTEYIVVNEGENIQIGTRKDGVVSLNKFIGGTLNTKKISFGGNDEGTGDVKILAGQNITKSNVDIKNVSFDLPPCRLKKPIIIE